MTPKLRIPLALRAFVIAIGVVVKHGLPAGLDTEVPASCFDNIDYACVMDRSEQATQEVPI